MKTSCNGCYCNTFMQNSKGCLYMPNERYDELYPGCPCNQCVVRIVCKERFNKCESFNNYLTNNLVRITEYARSINDY
jgi:hypothetical protein